MLGIWVCGTRAEPMISLKYCLSDAQGTQYNHFALLTSLNRFSFRIKRVIYPVA